MSRNWIVAAFLLLAVLGVFGQDAFFHTDDGCAVEIHCTACLWAHTTTSPGLAIGVPRPVLAGAGVVLESAARSHECAVPSVGPARAPPLA
jgi:hypothetical protein